MNPVERYLADLREIRSTGAAVPETSYYGALERILNELGKSLKPRVRAVINIKNRGAGIPDGGLFTSNQFQATSDGLAPIPGQLPERGVIEIKSTAEEVWQIAKGKQVSKYWDRYRLVLVTNYRDFLLIGEDEQGHPSELESYRLAESEADFWKAVGKRKDTAKRHSVSFSEYLTRVMLHAAALTSPRDVAWYLASYARDANGRIEGVALPALATVRQALEEALGLKFKGSKGEHFFRSTLVQTLFYGVFSAWVLWHRENPTRRDKFDWRTAVWSLNVPMIRALFEQVATPAKLGPLGIVDVLDWAAAALNRVKRDQFFARFEEEHAVQYFYEPFLEHFDPVLRKELGVWYTPREIVHYMVARVDSLLREEFQIESGLADERVYVLDPCCGTGAYLVEALRRIEATLVEKGGDALVAHDVKAAAMRRVFGFEILPAPFVIAHLQLGLLLHRLGTPLSDAKAERAGVYLTNALTGWESVDSKQHLIFPELEEERDASEKVKRDTPILVVLGNPPYNAFAGISPIEEHGLVDPYKDGLIKQWGIKKFNLDDLYVRFFRIAERRIAEQTGQGIVSYISNFSYLSDPSFVVLRDRFLAGFDSLWFDCLNGDSRETGKLTPEGQPDPSVFSTAENREGIRVGTVVASLVRRPARATDPVVRFRHFWGAQKRQDLVQSLAQHPFSPSYEQATPTKENLLSFRPVSVSEEYLSWPSLAELADVPPILGVLEKRKGALINFAKAPLESMMREYCDPKVPWENLSIGAGLKKNAARFNAKTARQNVVAREGFMKSNLRRLMVRPMEYRWCYYSAVRPLWNEPRPTLVAQAWEGNAFLVCRNKAVARLEGVPFSFTQTLGDEHAFHKDAYYVPFQLRNAQKMEGRQTSFLNTDSTARGNLSTAAHSYLKSLAFSAAEQGAALIWFHVLAIGYSVAYLRDHSDGVRQRWPRIPLPASKSQLLSSVALGRHVAALLNTETPVEAVTAGAVRSELQTIGLLSRVGGGALEPDAGHLALTKNWGFFGQNQAVMPGGGHTIERDYAIEEVASLRKGASALGVSVEQLTAQLGESTLDVYLNDSAYWRNVPINVWNYLIGGFQVLKKWLSYREQEVLGRGLTPDEAREMTSMVRRIAAILVLQPSLDANYRAVKGATFTWQKPSVPAGSPIPSRIEAPSTVRVRKTRGAKPSRPKGRRT